MRDVKTSGWCKLINKIEIVIGHYKIFVAEACKRNEIEKRYVNECHVNGELKPDTRDLSPAGAIVHGLVLIKVPSYSPVQ